jgi:PKD repeat protein
MKTQLPLTVAVAVLAAAKFSTVPAATLYVSPASPNPTRPYTNWTGAARLIQDAVDAAAPGDEIAVTNGIYATGGRAVGTNILVNRVAVDKPLMLRSVNGPQFTIIQGYQVPGTTNGDGAIRCVYLADGASLSGFTLTNGATRIGLASPEGEGGGVCCVSTNAALTNCVIAGNSAGWQGGGASGGTLYNCTLSGNSAEEGGGACGGTLYNCVLTGNAASWQGGGASGGTLYNCLLAGNSATAAGGGGFGGTLNNCTLTGNQADSGGGAAGGDVGMSLNNCIVYFNQARSGANYSGAGFERFEYCCSTPLPSGVGNIAGDPQLATATHLSRTSPCIGAGSPAYASGVDIDGEPWASPPAMGADQPGSATGFLSLWIDARLTNVAPGYALSFTARNTGPILKTVWDFGGGLMLTNQPVATHAWSAPGVYMVRLTGYNDSDPGGVTATVVVTVSAAVHYVNPASAHPVFPYGSWETAATNIQDAIGAGTLPGRLVLVTNGVYRLGTVAIEEVNRVALTNAVVVRSVNGPEVTVIEGETNSVRCAYVGNGSVLSGFTLTKGRATYGGGVCCESFGVVTNCTLTENSAVNGDGGGASGGTLYNCMLTANFAAGPYYGEGGGANGCTLYNCTLTGNRAGFGGGTSGGTLYQCTLIGNSAWFGGGASGGTLYNCTLTGNAASYQGGGASGGILYNRILTLYNCILTGNSADDTGGGAAGGMLYNCTLTGNSAHDGGGAAGGTLYNCIVYYNRASNGANYSGGSFAHSCTTPLPPGPGNTAADPELATPTHLSPTSPCLGAGNPAYATGVDIDGEPWADPPAMGADQPASAIGPLSLWIDTEFTQVAPGYAASFTVRNIGPILKSVWNFGDGIALTNQPIAIHAWLAPGDYTVQLTGYNDSYPVGVTATVVVTVRAAVHYVNQTSANPVFPYGSWDVAATNIQDAIAAVPQAGGLVLVTNGVYRVGEVEANGRNRVALTNVVVVRSVNGPEVTVIEGETNGVRCAYVRKEAVLSGFTLTKGNAGSGGGVCCESWEGAVTNCVLSANSAGDGGGASGGTLYNCALTRNSAEQGGGAEGCTLYNCTLSGNAASWQGGGAFGGTLYNCIVYFNTAPEGANYLSGTLNYCCTAPQPEPGQGVGNITSAPRFVDYAGGNLRLQSNSPCINAGLNACAPGPTDLDGLPRVVSGTVDIGAYEFQGSGSVISYAWLQQYGLPTDGSADFTDPDRDGMNNWQEWRCQTDPTNPLSVLRVLSASPTGTNVTVTWQSVAGVSYCLERSTNLAAGSSFLPLAGVITGQSNTTTYTDTDAATLAPLFYRVSVGQQ